MDDRISRKPGHVPLERALSKLGICSRTEAREWIRQGRVRVNGQIRNNPLFQVHPERARIEVDEKLREAKKPLTLLLHKPRGVITTRSDEKGRRTVMDLLHGVDQHVGPVGRLDGATTRLLILTNDTRLANWLTDPQSGIERQYRVTVRGKLSEASLERACQGIESQGELLQAKRATLLKASGRESHCLMVLTQGKNREIRRLFEALGHEVTQLKRISYGGLELGKLEPGDFRELDEAEILAAFPGAPLQRKG